MWVNQPGASWPPPRPTSLARCSATASRATRSGPRAMRRRPHGRHGSTRSCAEHLAAAGVDRLVAPPGAGRGPCLERQRRGARHRDGVGQVAGLPAAGADRGPGGYGTSAGQHAVPGPDQGAGRRPGRRHREAGRPRRAGSGGGRRLHARGARLGPPARRRRADEPRHAAPLPAAQPSPLGRSCSHGYGWWWWTSRTTTAACSARTSPGCMRRLQRVAALYGADPRVLHALGDDGRPRRDRRAPAGTAGDGRHRRRIAHWPDGRAAGRHHPTRLDGRAARHGRQPAERVGRRRPPHDHVPALAAGHRGSRD